MQTTPPSLGWEAGWATAWAGAPVLPAPPGGPLAMIQLADSVLLVGLTAAMVGIVAWVLRLWAKREIERRTGVRTQKMTELIEHAHCVLWEAEVELEQGDWTWRMQLHPSAFCRQLFRARDQQPGRDLWADFRIENRAEMNQRAREAMEGGRPSYEQEFRAIREGRTYWLHENVSITELGRDRFWLVGLVTDLTAQREAEAARRQSELTVERTLAHAQCMIWRATVIEENGGLRWPHFDLPRSQLSEELFGTPRAYSPQGGFWESLEMPEQAEMDARCRQAILGGAPDYVQQFRAITPAGRTFWLHERVSITQVGERLWSLVGVVTDITAQRAAEEGQQRSETRLTHLLARADSMIWQARVDRQEDGGLFWATFTPPSQLHRRIFGREPSGKLGFDWGQNGAPEHEEMAQRAFRAIEQGAPGYDQIFHVPRPEGTIWLSETVTINPTGPGAWDLVGIITDITARHQAEEASRESQVRLHKILALADCLLWEAKVELTPTEVIWDIACHQTGLTRQIFGEAPPPTDVGLWYRFQVPERLDMDRRAREALDGGFPGYEQQFRLIRPDRTFWLHESVTITRTGPNRFWLVGLATDVTVQREAEEARWNMQEQLRHLLTHANCMLWQAKVRCDAAGEFTWKFFVPSSELYRRIAGEANGRKDDMSWRKTKVPEYAEMEERGHDAMRRDLPGYEQIFHVVLPGDEVLWMREQTRVRRTADNEWSLEGVVIDITAQHRAEEAQQASELRLSALLEQADCMIWQGECRRLAADDFTWRIFTPRSQLFRRLFGRDPEPDGHFDWSSAVPEFEEIRTRSRQALTTGQPGYEQIFHYQHPDGDIWLNEKVSISPLGQDHWELIGIITNITARRESERALQVSEQRLGELLSRADCLVWESTVELLPEGWKWGRKIQPSMFYRRLTGSPLPSESQAMWPPDRVPERTEMDRRCREAIEGGHAGYEQVFRFVRQDGSTAWVSENVTIQRKDESRYWLVGVALDITAQRLSEAARQASEQRLQELLARADCLLWEATVELTPTDWKWQFSIQPSLLCQKLYGRAQPRPEQGLWRGFDIPECTRMHERCRTALREGRPGYDQIFHIIRPDGPVLWISENVTIRSLGDNRYSLVGVAVDITAQRGAEEALAAEKERLAVTLRAMNEAVITTDVTGCIQFMNPAAATLTERDAAECIGRPVEEICVLENIRTGTPVIVPIARVARGDVVADLPAQTRLVTRSGKRQVVEGCCAPIHAADSKVTGAVLVLRDVTEHERLEQELVRATRLESVGVLAGGIAHDFNNILTAVMGNLALAQLDIPPENPAAASLRSAEKAALRARDLTQQLLTFAKGGEPVRAAIQLEAVVREMAAFALHGSHVKAHYDLAPDLWPADADKGQIGRVVQNLVINAVQAMPRGGTMRIVARNDPHGGVTQPGLALGNYIQIAITDTGEGIKPENIARIFDPYFTTKQTGTGLGLAAVYSIIKKHRGYIEVESQPGQGTTFRFWLPALSGEIVTGGSKRPWAGAETRPMKGRVLFMDDEQIIRDMAVSLLERFGLTVDCAADGAEMVEKYRTELSAGRRYDLVIMDLTVPGGMGGLAALGELRKLYPGVNAVVSSGYSSDPVLAQYRQHGFAAVVAKPYEVGEILRVLRDVLPGT